MLLGSDFGGSDILQLVKPHIVFSYVKERKVEIERTDELVREPCSTATYILLNTKLN